LITKVRLGKTGVGITQFGGSAEVEEGPDQERLLRVLCIHRNTYRTCIQKWDRQRRAREEEEKERKIENNNGVHHICVGTSLV
jgi:hypothetical protein